MRIHVKKKIVHIKMLNETLKISLGIQIKNQAADSVIVLTGVWPQLRRPNSK